jgi:hypothetical protein
MRAYKLRVCSVVIVVIYQNPLAVFPLKTMVAR